MLSRFIAKSSNLRFLALISSQTHLQNLQSRPPDHLNSNASPYFFSKIPHFYSTDNNGKDSPTTSAPHLWNLSAETDESMDSLFGEEPGSLEGLKEEEPEQLKSERETQHWNSEYFGEEDGVKEDIFRVVKNDGVAENAGWATAEGYKPWSLGDDDKEEVEGLFDVGEENVGLEDSLESEKQGSGEVDLVAKSEEENLVAKSEEEKNLEIEEKQLTEILKGIPFIIIHPPPF